MNENRDRIRRLASYVRQNPDDSFSKFALALELLKNNEVEKTLLLFESIRKKDPDYIGIYYHLGKLYERIGRVDEALACFRDGVKRAENRNEMRTCSELQDALRQLEEEKQP